MLYLTRHGQTALNCAGRLQGRLDSDLTALGQRQADHVGQKLQSILGNTDVTLWVSPLGRAQQTAAIIGDYLQVSQRITDPRLAEIGLGDWEGMTMEDIEFTHPGALKGSGRYDWAYRAPSGEPREAFYSRLKDWLGEIETKASICVAVSHGWSGMGLRSIYTDLPFEDVTAKGDSHEAVFEFAKGTVRER
ncbi:MAG: histidine phosphatase family protein [Pseudomonadota bacterium]